MSDRVKDPTLDDAGDAVASIRQFVEFYFDSFPDDGNPLDADRTKAHIGIYSAYDPLMRFPVAKPVDPSDPYAQQPFAYRLSFDPQPVTWIKDGDDAHVDPAWKPSSKNTVVHLWHSRMMIDPVVDDTIEMRAAGFPYAELLGAMSPEARRVYGENLNKIVDRPAELTTNTQGAAFIKALALHGTYDSDGDYFAKWKPNKQNTAPLAAAITKRYFKASVREVELYEDCFYVIRQNELSTEIDLLYFDDKHGTKRVRYYSQKNNRFELTTYKKQKQLHDNFIFVYAFHGADRTWTGSVPRPKPWITHYDVDNPRGHSAVRRMVDPRRMVESAVHDEATGGELELRDEFEWFVEMVKAFFPNRVTIFDVAAFEEEGLKIDRRALTSVRKLVHDKLIESSPDGLGGPVSRLVLDKMLEMLRDPNLLVLPQGMRTGEHTRFIGGNLHFMYERDLRNGSVYMVPSDVYIWNLYVGQVAVELFEATRGLLPFIEVIVWGGLFFMGGAFLEVSPWAIRAWIVDRVETAIAGSLVKQLIWRFFRPAIIALVVELFAYIFKLAAQAGSTSQLADFEGTAISDMAKFASRLESFAKGFLRGYVVNTLSDHLLKHIVVDTAKNGIVGNIREVKMYLLAKRTYAAIDRVRTAIHTIEAELDGPTTHKATFLLEEVLLRLARGAAALFAVTYYLPHDDAKEVLETFGLDADGKPPSPEEWKREASHQITRVIGTLESITKLDSIDAALDSIEHGTLLPVLATVMILESELIWLAEYGVHHLPPKRKALVLAALLSIGVVGAYEANEHTDGKVLDVTKAVLGDLVKLPTRDEDYEKVGELIGNLFGAFFFNSVMFDKGGVFHEFRDKNPLLGGALWGNIKASPIEAFITILLKRYVLMYDRIRTQLSRMRRAPGDDAFVSAVHSVEDKALDDAGYGHLRSFRTDDENQLSLQAIALTIFRVRHVVRSDLLDWIKVRYQDDISRYKSDLVAFDKLAKAGGIDFHQIAEHDLPMMYHLVAQQLHQALDELCSTIRTLFEPFSKNGLSWVTLLKTLGIDIGDVSKVQKELMDAAKAELQDLKKKS